MAPNVRWRILGVCILLVTLVFIVFGQTIHFQFINFDDQAYVYGNPMVLKGLSLSGIAWAFTHLVSDHWHPLTVIILMLEHQIFGLWPGGYHLVNVLLHAIAVILLFLMLLEMTGAFWRSAFVAALFAVHPLRVESVAWIAECKDVLSGVFFMLTLWAYVRYVRQPESKARYALVLVWFALGLMSKPMLVTTPCVLLLLDYWPLGRLRKLSQFRGLLWEKLPFFFLSALSSVAAVLGIKSENVPISTYPANAPISYVVYLWKLIYPIHLALLYPVSKTGSPSWQTFCAVLLLAALTAGAWILRHKRPYLLIGWLWNLGMLVPVIGIMQTGNQAYADRYTYLPQIGLGLAGTWLAADWTANLRYRRVMLGSVAGVILCALLIAGWRQTAYWRDSESVWTRSIECTVDNYVAHGSLGIALFEDGRTEQAIAQYHEALRINPTYAPAHYNLGNALSRQGHDNEAIAEYREALRDEPTYVEAHNNLGIALSEQGHIEEAIAEYRQALRIRPDYPEAHCDLGIALAEQGHTDEAIAEFNEALQLDPNFAVAHNNLGNLLLQQGRVDDAIAQFREFLRVSPNDGRAHCNLGNALLRQGRIDEASAEYRKAVQLDPADVAVENYVAWMLATARQQSLRDGAKALQLAASANESTRGNDPTALRTLAAAYAQTGDFPKALETAQRALQLATTQSNADLANALHADINLYEAGRPIENGP